MIEVDNYSTLIKYKDIVKQCISLYYPEMRSKDLDMVIDYSINKRYKEEPARIVNSYTKKESNTTLLAISDYILRRKPITTAFGTMFVNHPDVPNPMASVVQQFLDNRAIHKKEMFKYPKGSEEYEHYNLLQQLDKMKYRPYYLSSIV